MHAVEGVYPDFTRGGETICATAPLLLPPSIMYQVYPLRGFTTAPFVWVPCFGSYQGTTSHTRLTSIPQGVLVTVVRDGCLQFGTGRHELVRYPWDHVDCPTSCICPQVHLGFETGSYTLGWIIRSLGIRHRHHYRFMWYQSSWDWCPSMCLWCHAHWGTWPSLGSTSCATLQSLLHYNDWWQCICCWCPGQTLFGTWYSHFQLCWIGVWYSQLLSFQSLLVGSVSQQHMWFSC